MEITIGNDELTIKIAAAGAELKSILGLRSELEYMWSGDPAFWGKTSPVLFPIVGTLKEGSYIFEGRTYALSRHGFARDRMFELVNQEPDRASFELRSDESTRSVYPFDFRLVISYQLLQDSLRVDYAVTNEGEGEMYFSIGAHPAFAVPIVAGTRYEDHHLLLSTREQAERWPITSDGLIDIASSAFLVQSNRIDLSHALFENDAIVLKHLKSKVISLRSDKHPHGLDFRFEQFPFLGIWAAGNADFVCIEPWCGIADSVNHDKLLVHKEGIEVLAPKSVWTRSWEVRFY